MNGPSVDWARPWLAHCRALGAPAERAARQHGVATALQASTASPPVRFVPQDALPPGEAYEAHIFRTGEVPTRDNLHDFFNGLAWLHFPQTKRRLNECQAAEIDQRGVGAHRGPLRDALTLFDENGAVLDAPPVLWDALVARDWHRLFVTERGRWEEARLLLFGHALLEKLTVPRKGLTAHVLFAPGARQSIYPRDDCMADALSAAHLATKPFVPLPVLGVPGWWPENTNFCFYDDSDVFRPRRPSEPTTTPPGPRRQAS
ncbi:DUF3025 domain-containing protein [Variovorax sp. ZT4R33]|uniref:DUF3025 domain-containing protein n=1 Tax=Variovorax sp. ZT4R33 TaxID=3443743 RepID=UPI003F463736